MDKRMLRTDPRSMQADPDRRKAHPRQLRDLLTGELFKVKENHHRPVFLAHLVEGGVCLNRGLLSLQFALRVIAGRDVFGPLVANSKPATHPLFAAKLAHFVLSDAKQPAAHARDPAQRARARLHAKEDLLHDVVGIEAGTAQTRSPARDDVGPDPVEGLD